MRKTAALLALLVFLALFSACTRSASSPAPAPATSAQDQMESDLASSLAIMQSMPAVELAPINSVDIGPIVANKAFVCGHTGYTIGTEATAICDEDMQVAFITLASGETIAASLYNTPENPTIRDEVKISDLATTNSGGSQIALPCTLEGIPPYRILTEEETTIRAVCKVTRDIDLTMVYTIVATPEECVPEPVLSLKEPGDFYLAQEGRYIAELAFPNVTGEVAPFVNGANWTQINPEDLPFSFDGAVGEIFYFHDDCEEEYILRWANQNLKSPPTQIEIWDRAGVLK